MARPSKYPEELLQRGVRLVLESGRPVTQVATDLGVSPETLRRRVKRVRVEMEDRPKRASGNRRIEAQTLLAQIQDALGYDVATSGRRTGCDIR